jgi:RES domain
MVLILPPPPTVTPRPQHETVETQTALVRIFNPASRYKTQASTYRYFGPLLRFDHHQPLTKEEAVKLNGKEDPNRGITYWGFTLSCCLVELFGDTKIVEFKDYQVAIATLEQPLLLLDIRDKGAMAAGSVAALGSVADRLVSQAWSRYFYEQIDIYQKVDGILYSNAHNGEKAIALYERSEPIISNAKIQTRPLKDRSIRHLIDAAVAENNMNCFEPYG